MNEYFRINGSLSSKFKYLLYGVYALLFIAVWHGSVGETLRPFPEILKALQVLFLQKGFMADIVSSLKLNLVALSTAIIFTLLLSYVAAFPAAEPISFIVSKGRFLGLMGLNAIFIEVFGLGMSLKVSLLTFGISVFFVTSMHSIVLEIPEARYDYARSLGLSSRQVFWQVVVRGTADQMMESFRQNAAIGWMMITAVEGIVKTGGIGDRLYNSAKHFDRAEVLAIIFVIVAIGLALDWLLKEIRKMVVPHVTAKRED